MTIAGAKDGGVNYQYECDDGEDALTELACVTIYALARVMNEAEGDERDCEALIDAFGAAIVPATKRLLASMRREAEGERAQQRTDSYYNGGNTNRMPIKPYVDEDGFTHRWMEVGGGGGGGSGRGRMDEGRKGCETE